MNIYLLGLILFAATVIIIELVMLSFRRLRSPAGATVRKRLRKYVYTEDQGGGSDILRKHVLSDIPFINSLLHGLTPIRYLDNLIIQANAAFTPGFWIFLSLLLAAMGFLGGLVFLKRPFLGTVFALFLGSLPYLQLLGKRKERIEKFRSQMPEGLDLIARALKAGHALTGGMKLAADQFPDPLGPEFSETLDEINFGVSINNALKNLATRMNCPEVRYFSVAVILQRETGGNLAELMESLAHLIRENYKFQGKVRTLAAEGKMSAYVLIGLPFFVAGWIKLRTPSFFEPLLSEPIGRIMLICAVIAMAIGIIVIQRMVKIDV